MTIKRMIYLVLGHVSLALGFIGIVLPVLPTTPFLLLASYFFYKSSGRLHDWLMNHPVFGSRLRAYIEHKAVSRRTKYTAIAFLWMSLFVSMLLIDRGTVRIIMAIVGTAVTIHLLMLKALNEDQVLETTDEFPENADDDRSNT